MVRPTLLAASSLKFANHLTNIREERRLSIRQLVAVTGLDCNQLKRIEKDPEFTEDMFTKARKEVEEHSWERRAERILNFLS